MTMQIPGGVPVAIPQVGTTLDSNAAQPATTIQNTGLLPPQTDPSVLPATDVSSTDPATVGIDGAPAPIVTQLPTTYVVGNTVTNGV